MLQRTNKYININETKVPNLQQVIAIKYIYLPNNNYYMKFLFHSLIEPSREVEN